MDIKAEIKQIKSELDKVEDVRVLSLVRGILELEKPRILNETAGSSIRRKPSVKGSKRK